MHEPRNAGPEAAARGRWVILGPLLFVIVLLAPTPAGIGWEAKATLALTSWMAAWWLSVAVPLAVTALLPLALLPALGVAVPRTAAAPYANPVIFLFMGGFFIAAAMQRWSLHRRVALGVVARTGTSPRRLVAGFMLASAVLSMWMSNTAAVLMMMPIGAAVLSTLDIRAERLDPQKAAGSQARNLGCALMLGIAYAGSIGGVATLIGTPPNAVLAALAGDLLDMDLSFARWLAVGLPLSSVMLLICWVLLCFWLFPLGEQRLAGADEVIAEEIRQMGRWTGGERVTAVVFALAGLAWIFRAPKQIGELTVPGVQTLLPMVGDATIAITAALILFTWPTREASGEWTRVLDWKHASSIPWDILVLFGGGLSLASAFESSGLTTWLGGKLTVLAGFPDILVIGAVAALFVFVTEVTSNTATATLGLPVVAALGPSIGVEPLSLMAAAAMGASMAFMLPVATPPNAIVFSTGFVRVRDMSRAGFWLNLASIAAITLFVSLSFG